MEFGILKCVVVEIKRENVTSQQQTVYIKLLPSDGKIEDPDENGYKSSGIAVLDKFCKRK